MGMGILVTGGAGFVGSHLCLRFKETMPDARVIAFDNLMRRGSERNLAPFRAAGVEFVHGDIRQPDDLDALPPFDLLIDCAAEPSVQAGLDGSPMGVIGHNLFGTLHLLDLARRRDAAFLFLSTSRVYPIAMLNDLPFEETESRFAWREPSGQPGCSPEGVSESAPLTGARSIYGATKLAGELLLQEYCHSYGLRGLINRCGILTGPRQMGKVDQGVVTLWVARHVYGVPLRYLGYGGEGKQVRDILHAEDLFTLLQRQVAALDTWEGQVYNVGGGREVSASLCELTSLCRDVTGNTVAITGSGETSPVDLRIYLTDARRVREAFDWAPRYDVRAIVEDIHAWIRADEDALRALLA